MERGRGEEERERERERARARVPERVKELVRFERNRE